MDLGRRSFEAEITVFVHDESPYLDRFLLLCELHIWHRENFAAENNERSDPAWFGVASAIVEVQVDLVFGWWSVAHQPQFVSGSSFEFGPDVPGPVGFEFSCADRI